ncbi:hypothetical protein V8F33_004524 [Rhypophila sp. PSN 637]
MPQIESIRTLICKGQWNLITGADDFDTIVSALPNLQEWHGSYSKSKSKRYLTMADRYILESNCNIKLNSRLSPRFPRIISGALRVTHSAPVPCLYGE